MPWIMRLACRAVPRSYITCVWGKAYPRHQSAHQAVGFAELRQFRERPAAQEPEIAG